MDGEGHPEGDEDVGDVEAGVEVGADGGGEGEGGVEAGAVGVRGRARWRRRGGGRGRRRRGGGRGQRGRGEAGGPVVDAEEAHGAGGHPVHEGRLVEEADAVDVGGDEVVALEHLAGDLDVDGVDVVEQAGGEEAAELEDEPGEDDEGDGAGVPAARGGRAEARVVGWLGSRGSGWLGLAWGDGVAGVLRSDRQAGDSSRESSGRSVMRALPEVSSRRIWRGRGGGRRRRAVRAGRRGACAGRCPSGRAGRRG